MESQVPPASPTRRDVSDEEWAFVAPYLTLMTEDAPQRRHELREVFNALRWIVRAGAPWRLLPTNFPPWAGGLPADPALARGRASSRRWCTICARCCAGPTGGADSPTAVIFDSRTRAIDAGERRSGPATTGTSGARAARSHVAVDTLGHLLALRGHARQRPGAGAGGGAGRSGAGGDRADASRWPSSTRATPASKPAADAAAHGIRLEVVKLPEAKRGFVLLPRRWVVERSFAWAARFRRLARDYERLPETVAGLHFVAFACLMLHRLVTVAAQSP